MDGFCVDLIFLILYCIDCLYGDRVDICFKVFINLLLCYFEERECCVMCKSVNIGFEGEFGNE